MARASRSKPLPPATAQEVAARTLALAVQDCDRKDGTGVDWPMLAEGIFRAGFEALLKLDDEARLALIRRVHEKTYRQMTAADDGAMAASSATPKAGKDAALKAFNAPKPKAPR